MVKQYYLKQTLPFPRHSAICGALFSRHRQTSAVPVLFGVLEGHIVSALEKGTMKKVSRSISEAVLS